MAGAAAMHKEDVNMEMKERKPHAVAEAAAVAAAAGAVPSERAKEAEPVSWEGCGWR